MAETPKLKRYISILNKIRNNEIPSKEEKEFFASYTPDTDSESFRSEIEALGMTGDDASDAIAGATEIGLADPDTKKLYLDHVKKLQKGKIAKQARTAINTALAVGDVITSTQQIRAANRAARRSQRPQRPAPLTEEPLLNQAIQEAAQGNFDIARRLAPAQQVIVDQYLSDMNTARVASTGQAGTFGALGQVASMRRGRGAQQLAAMANEIDITNRARQDQLLGMKLAQNQAIQQSQAQYYPTDLSQYGLDQQVAADLGATGRANLRGAVTNLAQGVPDAIANLRRQKIAAAMSQYGPEAEQAATTIDDKVAYTPQPMWNDMSSPKFLEQLYTGYFPKRLYSAGVS